MRKLTGCVVRLAKEYVNRDHRCLGLTACGPQDGTVCTNCKGWCEMNDMRRDGPEYTWTEDNTLCVCECDE